MNITLYKNFLLQRMNNAHLASGGKEVQCRCPECLDSANPSSAHFYISIPKNNKEPSKYYCHKCNCFGIVSYKKLIEWDIYDLRIAEELEIQNKNAIKKNDKYKNLYTPIIHNIHNTFITRDNKSEEKRQYICHRLGIDLSFEILSQLKISINLKDLLNENGIIHYNRNIGIINDLDREFIGFISIDNSFLNMRRTCTQGKVHQSIDKRYINYQIFPDDIFDTDKRFYTIPSIINLNQPSPVKMHMAEGPFDILSIYFNCRHQEPGIYTSIAGNNYLNVINYFIIEKMIPNIELHIYPDSGRYGSRERLMRIKNRLKDPYIPIFIHRNLQDGEKDFGVPISRIQESIERL